MKNFPKETRLERKFNEVMDKIKASKKAKKKYRSNDFVPPKKREEYARFELIVRVLDWSNAIIFLNWLKAEKIEVYGLTKYNGYYCLTICMRDEVDFKYCIKEIFKRIENKAL